jgi:hypothetical protein
MALAVEGSRLITVDGIVYRWRLRRRATYNQMRGDTPLTLAVERAESSGCVLTAAVPDVSHPASLFAGSSMIVRPALVAAVIRIAWAADGSPPSQAHIPAQRGERRSSGRGQDGDDSRRPVGETGTVSHWHVVDQLPGDCRASSDGGHVGRSEPRSLGQPEAAA